MNILNAAGETVATVYSDMEAVRWYAESGRVGDTLADTGETLHDVAESLGYRVGYDARYDTVYCVIGLPD